LIKLKIFDYIIIFTVIILIILSYLYLKNNFSPDNIEIITTDKRLHFSLKKDIVITIKGAIGEMRVEIKNMKLRVIESSCPNKICIKSGWISKNGEHIACIPNKVLITLTSSNKNLKDYDFIVE